MRSISSMPLFRSKWAIIAGPMALVAAPVFAQEPPQSFEVATVRASTSVGGINNRRDPVLATWINAPLAAILWEAYGIQPDQLIGGPAWIHSDRWDIIGKTDKPSTRAEQRKMLQPLLAERFRLKVRWEIRQLPQYKLILAKGGPKVRESSGDGSVKVAKGVIEGDGMRSLDLAFWLRSALGRPVIDHTGLTGKYSFNLRWVPDETPSNGGDPPSDSAGPTIFTALQELGLRLKAIQGPMGVLVVDHVEKPSEN